MMYDSKFSNVNHYRTTLVATLLRRKMEIPGYTVIDVGGSIGGWSSPVADAIVDMNSPTSPNVKFFSVNLNDVASWTPVLEYVSEHGKFSYAICSHTLEDICNPKAVLDMLPQIAEAGSIAVPSKHYEFSRIEGPYLGYIHHRWIYDIRNGIFVGYPKLGFLEYYAEIHRLGDRSPDKAQLDFEWKDTIEYSFVNNDYLGPNVQSVYMYYRDLLQ